MAVGRIDDDGIDLGLHQSIHAVEDVGGDTDTCGTKKTSLGVLRSQRILDGLLNIFDCNQTLEVTVLVHNGKLLLAGLGENHLRLVEGYTLRCGNQPFTGHGFADLLRKISLKLQVTVCDNTDQPTTFGNRHTADAVFAHQIIGILQSMVRREIKRIADDAVLRALYLVHLIGLRLDCHVLVNDTDSPLACHCNGHTMLRNGIHTGAHQRNVQFDGMRQLRTELHLIGNHLRVGGNQQHVVKCDAVSDNSSHSLPPFYINY